MNKTCKVHGTITDVTPDQTRCPECGELFIEDSAVSVGAPSGVAQDNRLHYGDSYGKQVNGTEINAAGDYAQNIDKSTTMVTNNSSTTYVEQAKDEGMTVVDCEFSWEKVRLIDTFTCPKCKRRGKKVYRDHRYNCCEDCAKELKQKNEAAAPQAYPAKPQPQATRPATNTAPAAPQRVATEADKAMRVPEPERFIAPASSSGGGKWLIVVGIIAIGVAAFFFMRDKDDAQPAEKTVAENVVENPKTVEETTPKDDKTSTKVAPNTGKTTVKPEPKTEEPKIAPPEPSPLEKAIAAYKGGNYAGARVLLQDESLANDATASYYLGEIYFGGKGTGRDLKKGFSYMKKAAEGGCALAYFPLAEMYRNGDGTEANRTLAKKWYEKAVVSDSKNAAKAAEYLSLYE